ncbi:glutamate-5-semialdehyde dehydrogenase [Inconstantimicrobium mannanitabidum]|uniref:Gamma-glutamyl phosphate reductase n=1 Tax=Inconstantimicrobium mannanitabidum TaxID=1604901 RepID=A0ACB5RG81_9CLOT|nr:glutamate-5-semialdehyde dehydrogenase [Clostridium sp. TW13]GKX68090.1 gamma-glutamyl phosphate reductase [Clostridium sp. TW13]
MENLKSLGEKAKVASKEIGIMDTCKKNKAIEEIAKFVVQHKDFIIKANEIDIENARNNSMKETLIDRLLLTEDRINSMAKAVMEIVALDDPVGEVDAMWKRPNGLEIGQKRVPLGVIGIIYEARPNVTLDAAALCLKSGNAVILRGGSEAINSNKAIVDIIRDALEKSGLPKDSVQLIQDTSRETTKEMMKMNEYIDVLIPRGGAGLIKAVKENSSVPVIETGTGNCHAYVDDSADFEMALNIIINAKCSRPSVCNALESILINENIAEKFVPVLCEKLRVNKVEIRGCEKVKAICTDVVSASEEDWAKEYLDYIVSVKIVNSIDEAIQHIDKYSTGHSETIITNNYQNAQRFLNEVNSAVVYVNASTRFTDGGEMGFGAEIGISTQKLHARGPMGLKQLTTIKYIVYGNGQIR